MVSSPFEEMKHRIGFTEADVSNLQALASVVEPVREAITDAFYRWLFADPRAKLVFTGGQPQIDRQRQVFSNWLAELFKGPYDELYYRNRLAIGQAHVRVGLPQHYMFTAMEAIWEELRSRIQAAHAEATPHLPPVGAPGASAQISGTDAKLISLHKLLTLEMAVMLESYKDSYTSQIRQEERTVAEEKLTRSEHLAQLGQLAASLAHEIKNPLAGISGAIQVIRDGMRTDDPHRAVIREILGQINRLDAAVKDLLVYARPRPPELSPVDIGSIVSRVLKVMRDAPIFRRVHINLESNGQVHYIAADSLQIEQLVMNLVVNAAQACREGDRLTIQLSDPGQKVRMVIADTGCGMEESIAARAFEPFFTTKAKGTGLGLSICKKIVDAHQGTIALRTVPDVGTEVTIEFPRLTSSGHAPAGQEVGIHRDP
jgi:two-component system, NtrC family, sensor histidine kinase HydH